MRTSIAASRALASLATGLREVLVGEVDECVAAPERKCLREKRTGPNRSPLPIATKQPS